MATITQRLAFLISANADGAIKAFDKTAIAAEKQLGKAQKSIDRLGANMTKFGAAGLAAAGTLGAGLFRLAQGAIEDQKAQALLAEQLRTSTGATDAQIAAVEKNIDAMARATGVADDQLRPALGNLVRATGEAGKAQQLLQAGLDISAATGRDLETVSLALSKAYMGNAGALTRLGIPLSEAAKKSKDFDTILAEVTAKTGGAAAVAADTYAGKMQRAQVAISEAGESLGSAFIPFIEQASKLVADGANLFDKLNGATGGLVGKFAAFGTVGLGAVSALSLIGGQAIKLRSQFFLVDEATGKLTRNLTGLGKFVGAGTALIGAATIAYSIYSAEKEKARQRTQTFADALALEGEAQREALKEAYRSDDQMREAAKLANALGFSFIDMADQTGNGAAQFKRLSDAVKGSMLNKLVVDNGKLTKTLGLTNDLTFEQAQLLMILAGEVRNIRNEYLVAADAANIAADGIGAASDAANGAAEADMTAAERLKAWVRPALQRDKIARQIAEGNAKLAASTGGSAKATEKDTEATRKNNEAKAQFKQRVEDAASALRTTLNDALESSKQKLVDATEAYNSYMTGISSAISGTINFGAAQSTATANAEALTSAQQAVTKAQQEYNDALKGDDTDRIAETYKTLTEAQDTFAKASQKPTGFLAVLQDQGRAAARFGDNLDKLLASNLDQVAIDQIAGLGAEVGNQVAEELLSGADPAGKIAEVNRLIKSTQDIADRVGKAAASKFKQAGVDQATALVTGVQQVFDEWYPKLDEKNLAGVVDPLKTIAGWADIVRGKLSDLGAITMPTPAGAIPNGEGVYTAPDGTPFYVPDVGDWRFPIPAMADGGIVKARNGGTLVRVGEGGRDEAVIPLPSNMGGQTVNVTINVNGGDPNAVVDALKRYVRTNGALPNVIKVSQ